MENQEWGIPFIHLHTIDPLVTYETAGYFRKNNNKLRFYKTGVSNMDPVNQRRRVYFPYHKSWLLWHTHTIKDGFWPSLEDLRYGGIMQGQTFNTQVNVLFTTYGTWIYKGFSSFPSDRHIRVLHNKWNDFSTKMEKLTGSGTKEEPRNQWIIKDVDRCIVDFLKFLNDMLSYHITFISNFKNEHIESYSQKVYAHISKTIK
jgi:hypothetical protein